MALGFSAALAPCGASVKLKPGASSGSLTAVAASAVPARVTGSAGSCQLSQQQGQSR